MAKQNMLMLSVSIILAVLRITSIVYKSIALNNIRKNNKNARDGKLDKNGDPIKKKSGDEVNALIADLILIIISGLCIYKCCTMQNTRGLVKSICITVAILMLINGFPHLLEGRGKPNSDLRKTYPERLVYGLTGIVNSLVSTACCL